MKIYFDMDGVLADFDAAVAEYNNGESLNRQTKSMTTDEKKAKQMRWQWIENKKSFWANIPVVKGINDVLDVACKMGDLFVLTKVPGAKNFIGGDRYVDFIEAQKRMWIKQHFSEFFDDAHVIVARISKEELLHPGKLDLLIDDRSGNVSDWVAAGGCGIVFSNVAGAIKDLKQLRQNKNV